MLCTDVSGIEFDTGTTTPPILSIGHALAELQSGSLGFFPET